MAWKATIRAMEAAERRQQREAKKRQRELERQAKEMAKLSALEQARIEVETYENALDVLLSIHKEQADPTDWIGISATLPPVPPSRHSYNEFKARQCLALTPARKDTEIVIVEAKQQDEREYQEALQAHADAHAEWEKMSNLSRRILALDSAAYLAAIKEINPFSELADIGSSLHFKVHNPRLVEVVINTKGRQAIPSEIKTLTESGKVSIKTMPKSRFVEIYQDYISGCVLRVARELFALLPIETLLISASADALAATTGTTIKRPFLSVVVSRAALKTLNFDTLDPSDCIMAMTHRGDLKASRKSGDFEFITPMTIADLTQQDAPAGMDLNAVLAAAQQLRAALAAQCAAINPEPAEALLASGET